MSVRLGLLCSIALCAAAAQQITPMAPAEEAGVEKMIAIVQRTPAARLDAFLPSIPFEEWLQDQAGPGGKLAWAYRYDPSGAHRLPDCVEADATLPDGRTFFVMINVSGDARHPRFREANVITKGGQMVEVAKLCVLPRVLRSPQSSNHTEALNE